MKLRSGKLLERYLSPKEKKELRPVHKSPNFTWDIIGAGIVSDIMLIYYQSNDFLNFDDISREFLEVDEISYDSEYDDIIANITDWISDIISFSPKNKELRDLIFFVKDILGNTDATIDENIEDYSNIDDHVILRMSKEDIIDMSSVDIRISMSDIDEYEEAMSESYEDAALAFLNLVLRVKIYNLLCQDLRKKLDELTGLLNLQIALQSCKNLQ